MLRTLTLGALALTACPDFDGAYERCASGPQRRCVEELGDTYELHLFAVDDPVGASFEVTPPGAGCGPNCFRYLAGTQVRVRAVPVAGRRLARWEGDCSSTDATCTLLVAHDLWVRVRLERLSLAFVTSSDVAVVGLGDIAGADAFCRAHAEDAGLTGEFVAWLSTQASPAGARLDGGTGWVTTRGELIAASLGDLLGDGLPMYGTPAGRGLIHPIGYDERGRPRSGAVATGTSERGLASFRGNGPFDAPALQTCGELRDANRRVTVGHTTGARKVWTDAALVSCLQPLPLYCFELPRGSVAPAALPLPGSGKRAFVTATPVPASFGGAGGADARCAAEALDAGWAGSFGWRPQGPGPWFRRDGLRVLGDAGAALEAPLLFPPRLDEDGLTADDDVWVAGGFTDCLGWTSSAIDDEGDAVSGTLGDGTGLGAATLPCSVPAHLTCFER